MQVSVFLYTEKSMKCSVIEHVEETEKKQEWAQAI